MPQSCDPKVLRVAARLRRREMNKSQRQFRKRQRAQRKTGRQLARLSGCSTFLGLPWEAVEEQIAIAINVLAERFDFDEIDPVDVASMVWKALAKRVKLPSGVLVDLAAELIVHFVLEPMVERALEAGRAWIDAKTETSKAKIEKDLTAACDACDLVDDEKKPELEPEPDQD